MSDALAERAAALGARLDTLKSYSRWLFRGGVFLLAPAALLWRADPGGRDLFGDYIAVPAPLDRILEQAGAAIRDTPPALTDSSVLGFNYALFVLVFLVGHSLIQRIPNAIAKYVVYSAFPIWVFLPAAIIGNAIGTFERVNSVRAGIVADRPGAPAAKADGTNRPPVPAYHLRPEALPPLPADQARVVLAQQAYIDDDPARAAAHLRGLTGAWRPSEADERERIAALARWAAARGAEPGEMAREVGGGVLLAILERAAAFLLILLTALGVLAAVVLDIIASGRRKTLDRLIAKAATAPDEPFVPPARSFGRRVAARA